MHNLIVAGLALFLFPAACVSVATAVEPSTTVRIMTEYGQPNCSAVVIEPDYALTARHCLDMNIMVDGLPVDRATAPMQPAKDIAVVHVPGLQCPCAPLGGRPKAGDKVMVVGFPVMDEGKQRVTAGTVASVQTLFEFAPWMGEAGGYGVGEFVFSTEKLLDPGHSGGGLFALQNGKWRLVAINVIGVPDATRQKEIASGFTLIGLAEEFLP